MVLLSSPRNRLLLRFRLFSTTLSPPSISLSSAKSKLRSEFDPDKALAIFSSISKPSSSSSTPTPISFSYALDLTVKRLFKSRRFADIETLIESQKTHNPIISQEPFLSSLILSYGRATMLDHAIRTFADMDLLGTPRSTSSFNALLAACIHPQKLDRVAELFAEFPPKYGISPDKMSYGILIKSQCELGSPETSIETLKEMEEMNVEITTIAYTTIVDALYRKGKIEAAEEIWDKMHAKGCCLDVGAYNVKLRHTHHGKPEEVQKLIMKMGASGVKPDIISYNYLLKCYFANNQTEEAKKVYKDLWELRCLPNAWTFNIMVHYLCENGEFDTALRVCKASIKRNKIPDFRTVRSLLEGLVKNLKMRDAKALIDMVRKRCPERFSTEWSKIEMELGLKGSEKGAAAEVVAAA
eukprot:TRINITY_DN2485_c0_g2_i1.p1 TRINITY_DN2485_c0_g2~~TRINITY_DN2485_c0_g2_i1.p1  ORF type:complete len:412 (-),score=78.80 TRINITY_DN2485_c0_g2_i1:2839-4074(-)